jgi:diguanylate cyclase (GGDEF)-like protein
MKDTENTLEKLLALDNRALGVVQDMSALLGEMQRLICDLAHRNRQLELLATTDPLTNLTNRRGFEEELAREEARIRRERGTGALVLIDVRSLKAVNERFGHGIGDELLRGVAGALRSSARKSDVVARLGGDEFAALLPGAGRAGGESFVERVRTTVRTMLLPSGATVSVQLAAGVAVRDEAESLHEALQLADGRLLMEKQRALA